MISQFIVFAWLSLCFAHAYTVRSNESILFPAQKADSTTSDAFIRIYASHNEVLRCPQGFAFSNKKLKCVVPTTTATKAINNLIKSTDDVCPSTYRGTLPDPLSCRSFYNCWDGIGYEMDCNDHLLYNERSFQCDWPEAAGCCEYWEKNSTLIVQSS